MLLPNDILVYETSDEPTVWVSQRLVIERCGVSEATLKDTARVRYKKILPASWQKKAEASEFLLDFKAGTAWRWGFKYDQFYYDVDTIPNRKPTCYRDQLPSKSELIALVNNNNRRQNRERQAERRRDILDRVQLLVDNHDAKYFKAYRLGDKQIYDEVQAKQLADAVAWCRFMKLAATTNEYKEVGFTTLADFRQACVDILETENLEGLRISTAESLRQKLRELPDDHQLLRDFLVSGRFGNNYARKIGKFEMVDYTTGEVLRVDEHEVIIMTYWLNPGGSTKETKRALWERYASDMEAIGKVPVSPSTFNHFTNMWHNKVLSARERHGKTHAKNNFRPYVPSKSLEFANSLWASDGSGIVPYRYQDQYGKWRMMKLYTMLVSDVASRYLAGYAVSRRGQHVEDFPMLRTALRMALDNNGRTEVLDFISDNHGAYTGAESKAYLSQVCRKFRTIQPGNSQANPAETIFRLFKRRFKSYFNLPETSWGAQGLESMANPDRFDIMALPTYSEAIVLLETAIREWNTTELSNGYTPERWFNELKNPAAQEYDACRYRRITGNVSKKDLSYSRGTMTLEHAGMKCKFDVPTDADSVALIAQYMGYSPSFSARVYWNVEGADVYTEDGVFMFTCQPSRQAAKSMSEANSSSLSALQYHTQKGEQFDEMVDGYENTLADGRETLFRNYEFNIHSEGTKEAYNNMREGFQNADYNRQQAKAEAKERRAAERQKQHEAKAADEAALAFAKSKISDISKYLK